MSHVLVIAGREIRERKMVFVAAALIAVLSALAPLIPGTRVFERRDILIMSAVACAVAFTAALAIALGGGIVGGDLRSGRMSFYFSKPVSASAIWFGKVLGVLTTMSAAFVIILIPALLLGGRAWEVRVDKPLRLLLITGGALLLLFLVSHLVSTLIASRSLFMLIDLAIALAMTAGVYFIVRPLALARATDSATQVTVGVLLAFALAILAAGAWQLARGRTDARRNHVELSRVVWTLVLLAVLAGGGYSKWIRTLTPKNMDLWGVRPLQSPSGDWVVLEGKHRYTDYIASLAMDIKTGQTTQIPARDAVFSHDGRTIAWLQPAGKSYHVVTAATTDLNTLRDAGISVAVPSQMVLSDDGARIAIFAGETLFVQEIATKKLLGSVRVPRRAEQARMFFETPDTVRVYTQDFGDKLQTIEALRFSLSSRKVEWLGRYVTEANTATLIADSTGSRLLLREARSTPQGETGIKQQLVDAMTLRPC
jgi:hypothetical protein